MIFRRNQERNYGGGHGQLPPQMNCLPPQLPPDGKFGYSKSCNVKFQAVLLLLAILKSMITLIVRLMHAPCCMAHLDGNLVSLLEILCTVLAEIITLSNHRQAPGLDLLAAVDLIQVVFNRLSDLRCGDEFYQIWNVSARTYCRK